MLTIDQRVSALEQQVAQLLHPASGPDASTGASNWRATAGMFAGDAVMREIIEEGRKIREREREQARQ